MNTLWVAVGGAIGSVARYWVAAWCASLSRSLPVGTILINVTGSFLIGLLGSLTLQDGRAALPPPLKLFLMVGFCGGFTTFSAFSLQTLELLRAGAWSRAATNVLGSVLLCLGAVAAGYGVARRA